MGRMADDKTDTRGSPKGVFGQPAHVVTEANQRLVEKLAGLPNVTQAEIGMVMGISHDTIARHYPEEFARGRAVKGVNLKLHAYDLANGVWNDPEDHSKGYKVAPDANMVRFLLERQFGLIQKTESTVALTELSPEAAEWLGRPAS